MNNCIYRKYHAFCHPGSEKRQSRIFDPYHPALNSVTTTCATLSAELSSIYCVNPSLSDQAHRGEKGRFVYSLTVVHFRKVLLCRKVGSPGNGRPVI